MGKLITIEGLDGAGKSTQIDMIINYLKSNNKKYEFVHFPILNNSFISESISKFLRGEFGNIDEVSPYFVSMLFAQNRFENIKTINKWLNEGYTVLLDRYVYSNIAFQCAKINDSNEKLKLKKWLLDLEFGYFKLPKPDLSIYIDVPISIIKERLSKKRAGKDREYLNGKEDIHEQSIDLQINVDIEYKKLINEEDNFYSVNTFENNSILSPEIINSKIINLIK